MGPLRPGTCGGEDHRPSRSPSSPAPLRGPRPRGTAPTSRGPARPPTGRASGQDSWLRDSWLFQYPIGRRSHRKEQRVVICPMRQSPRVRGGSHSCARCVRHGCFIPTFIERAGKQFGLHPCGKRLRRSRNDELNSRSVWWKGTVFFYRIGICRDAILMSSNCDRRFLDEN